MSKPILKRSRQQEDRRDRPSKKPRKFKKQLEYHSSDSEDEEPTDFKAVNLQDSDEEYVPAPKSILKSRKEKFVADDDEDAEDAEADSQDGEEDEEEAGSDATGASSDEDKDAESESEQDLSDGDTSTIVTENGTKQKKKRNDPAAFATSISKILGSKLTTTKRADPVLSRSASAAATSKALADSKLEVKARQKLRADRKLAMEKGRIRDVMGLETPEESTEAIMEREKRLRKTAQRGVVKLFNAVREAQKRGEAARREARKEGLVGMGRREEKVSEMSKQGFLDLIAGGGKKAGVAA